MEITIEVQGQASTLAEPERAFVQAAVTADGPEPGPVKQQVAAGVDTARRGLDELVAQGAVTSYAVGQIQISQHRPWNEQGEQLPLVHTATAGITAEFCDLRALGQWVMTDGLLVHGVDWRLTPAARARVEREVRQQAVREAATRAQDYADALRLGPVSVRSVRDAGIPAQPGMQPRMLAAAVQESGPAVELSAEPLEVAAEVHATFVAGSVGAPEREDST